VNQKIITDFIKTTNEIKNLMEKNSIINCDTKVVPKLQFFAVRYISKNPGITVGELAKVLMMSSGSIAQLIERLVEKDWIQKEIDDTDKRVSHLFLTHNGEAQVEEMRKIFTKKMKNMLSLIPEDDLKEIIRIQENLLKQLKKEKDV